VFVVALPLSGCIALPIPHDRQVSPEFYGVITDVDSGARVSGAEVAVVSESGMSKASTAADGMYRVKAEKHSTWYVLFLGPWEGGCSGDLSVAHPDYETQSTSASEFRGAAANGVCSGYKVERNIQLKRKSAGIGTE